MSSNKEHKIEDQTCPDEINEAGFAPVCGSCDGQRLCQDMFNKADTDIEDINTRMSVIKHKLLVLSGKGGVGKSTLASTLALLLAKNGNKVGILDLDICGPSIANLLNVQSQTIVSSPFGWKPLVSPHYGIKVMSVAGLLSSKENAVIFKGPRKTYLIKRILKETFWGKLDYLVCDTPPGTSDEHLTIVKLLKHIRPDGAIIVSTPQRLCIDAVRKEISFCKKLGVKITGLVENMSMFVCPCCQEAVNIFPKKDSLQQLARDKGLKYLGDIPIDEKIAKYNDCGMDVFSADNLNRFVQDKYIAIVTNIQECIS